MNQTTIQGINKPLLKLKHECITNPLPWYQLISSINSFNELSAAFIMQYYVLMKKGRSDSDLWNLAHGPHEPLWKHILKLKEILVKIPGISQIGALSAIRNGLWHESRFREELTVNCPTTIQDALFRENSWIEVEEEKLTFAKKYSRRSKLAITPPARKLESKDVREPRHFGMSPRSNNVERPSLGRGRFGVLSSNKSVRNESSYCDIHQANGHTTKECSVLKRHLTDLWATGELASFKLEEFVQQYRKKRDKNEDSSQSIKKQRVTDRSPSSLSKRRIVVIIGRSKLCKDSVRAINRHKRADVMEVSKEPRAMEANTAITFEEFETQHLAKPHDDTLFITLDVANYKVSRILIDTGTSVDLIFLSTLQKMGINWSDIVGPPTPLIAFPSETSMSLGIIKLYVLAAGVPKIVEFTMFNRPAAKIRILGIPWIYK